MTGSGGRTAYGTRPTRVAGSRLDFHLSCYAEPLRNPSREGFAPRIWNGRVDSGPSDSRTARSASLLTDLPAGRFAGWLSLGSAPRPSRHRGPTPPQQALPPARASQAAPTTLLVSLPSQAKPDGKSPRPPGRSRAVSLFGGILHNVLTPTQENRILTCTAPPPGASRTARNAHSAPSGCFSQGWDENDGQRRLERQRPRAPGPASRATAITAGARTLRSPGGSKTSSGSRSSMHPAAHQQRLQPRQQPPWPPQDQQWQQEQTWQQPGYGQPSYPPPATGRTSSPDETSPRGSQYPFFIFRSPGRPPPAAASPGLPGTRCLPGSWRSARS